MGLYNNDTKRKKKRLIMHEPGEYSGSELGNYAVSNYPRGEDAYYSDRSSGLNDFSATRDSLFNQVYTGQTNIQPIFESDAQRMVAGDVDDIYDDMILEVGDGKGSDELFSALEGLQEGDDFVMMGHKSTGNDPMYGGIDLKDMARYIPEGVNCYLGACGGAESGQSAANALGRDVTAQSGSDVWTGAQEAATTTEAFTRPFPGIFEKGDDRSKVYKPTFKLDWAKPTI